MLTSRKLTDMDDYADLARFLRMKTQVNWQAVKDNTGAKPKYSLEVWRPFRDTAWESELTNEVVYEFDSFSIQYKIIEFHGHWQLQVILWGDKIVGQKCNHVTEMETIWCNNFWRTTWQLEEVARLVNFSTLKVAKADG